jgi:hypothetical protein
MIDVTYYHQKLEALQDWLTQRIVFGKTITTKHDLLGTLVQPNPAWKDFELWWQDNQHLYQSE